MLILIKNIPKNGLAQCHFPVTVPLYQTAMALESPYLEHKKGSVTLCRLQPVVPHKYGYTTYHIFSLKCRMSTPALFACALVLSKAFENRLKPKETCRSWVSHGYQPSNSSHCGCKGKDVPPGLPYDMLACGAHMWESLQPLKSSSTCFRATCSSDWSNCACMAQECTLGAVEAAGAGSGKCWAWGWKLCFPALDLMQIFLYGFRQASWSHWLSICTALFPRR